MLCVLTYPLLFLPHLYTQPSTQRWKSIWCTESDSEHTEKKYMFQLIYTYLYVRPSLLNTLRTCREAQQSKQTYRGSQEERSEHNRNHLCTEPDYQTNNLS